MTCLKSHSQDCLRTPGQVLLLPELLSLYTSVVDRDSATSAPQILYQAPLPDHILPGNWSGSSGPAPGTLPPTKTSLFSGLELCSPVSQSLEFFCLFFYKEFSQVLIFLVFVMAPLRGFLPPTRQHQFVGTCPE